MKRIFFTAILFLILTINSQANNSVIIFYKNDCPYCMEMRESLVNDAEFRKYMNQNFVVTLVDIQSKEGSAIAELYNVRAVPTILKYDEASGKTSVLKGFGSIKRLSGFLNSGVAPAVTATVKSQLSTCGNGEIEGDEQCDDGNAHDNDGCSKLCEVEQGWSCEGNPSLCTTISEPLCGNGSIEGDEQCDDGNMVDTDGCNNSCEIIERSYCGNGEIEGDEQCDDGNMVDTDGCNNSCKIIERSYCGNGEIEGDEQCDDGNALDNDGCNKLCEVEQGWLCEGNPSLCSTISEPLCRNGSIEGDEQCDDGNAHDNDGCNKLCKVEQGWSCEGNPSLCTTISEPLCGNGSIEGDEQCDDGNAHDNDGCNKLCEVEQGWLCEGNPSLCSTISEPLCGNGSIEGDEQCDDGNAHDNDGCNKLCEVEQGWLCKGNPSLCESIVGISERKTISNSSLTRPVYPNPFTKNITISLFLTGAYDIDIFVIDVNGKITNQFVINGLQTGNNNINLDLSDLLPGNYILSLKNKDNSNLFNKAVRIRKDQ